MGQSMKTLYHTSHEERRCITNQLASFLDADVFHDVDIDVYLNRCEAGQAVLSLR